MFQTTMQGRPNSISHSHWLSFLEQYPSSSPKMRSWVFFTSWSPYIGSVCKGCITIFCPPLASSNATTDCSQMSYVKALGFKVSSKANNGRAYVATSSLATWWASQKTLILARPFEAFDTSLTSNNLCNFQKTCISFTSNGHMRPMNTSSCIAKMKEPCE